MTLDLSDILFVLGVVCVAWPLAEHFGSVAVGVLGAGLIGVSIVIGGRS